MRLTRRRWRRKQPEPPPDAPEPDDCAYLIYTSGTTGRPKGVMLSHRGMMEAARLTALESLVRPADRLALTMPLYHIGGRLTSLAYGLHGCPTVLHQNFRPQAFFESLQANSMTTTLLAPTMLGDLLDATSASRESLPALARLFYSAAPMPEALLRCGMKAFGPIFAQFYGMTESAGPGCVLHAHQHVLDGPEHVVRRLRSAGQPMIGCDVRVVDLDGVLLPGGRARRDRHPEPSVMTGYWRNPRSPAACRCSTKANASAASACRASPMTMKSWQRPEPTRWPRAVEARPRLQRFPDLVLHDACKADCDLCMVLA